MAINSVLQTGLQGMRQSQGEMLKSAEQIASAATTRDDLASQVDLAEPLIELKRQEHLFDASAKVVKTADDLLGTLMDIRA